MNFFQLQEQARVRTRRLIFVYLLAVVFIVVALDAVFLLVKGLVFNETSQTIIENAGVQSAQSFIISESGSLILFSLGIIGFIGLASLYRVMSLRGGGSKVASALGGTRVDGNHPDRKVRRLVNTVEEMAIASGLPVPQVYVLEQESGINAFAAGNQPEDAAVAVTRGALEVFSRDELQGVIGHEFSHILNGDMRMNMRLLGPLFGIMLIGAMGGLLLRGTAYRRVRSSRDSGGGVMVILLLGVGLTVIGYIGQMAGRMIKAAISRQREYLADASAVQFTRDREGIGGALKKIAAWSQGSALMDSGAEEVSHMLFANGLSKQFSSLFSTHPPIEERIQQIGMSFSNQELARLAAEMQKMDRPGGSSTSAADSFSVAGFSNETVSAFSDNVPMDFDNETLLSARAVIDEVPKKVRTEVESTERVREVVLALLLSDDAEVKGHQIKAIQNSGINLDRQRIVSIWQQLDVSPDGLRLPILDMAFPTMRQLTLQQRMSFYQLVEELIPLDGQVSSFEYMLSRLLLQMLEENSRPDPRSGTKKTKLSRIQYHLRTLFSVVATFGHDTEKQILQAYNAGMGNLFGQQQWPDYYLPADWTAHFDDALQEIDRVRPLIKEEIISSLMYMIGIDNEYRIDEYEMLRVISALLHCPMPLTADMIQRN